MLELLGRDPENLWRWSDAKGGRLIEAYTKAFIRRLGDYDKPRTRKVTLTRQDGEMLVGVVEGLVWKFKPREIYKQDGARFTKRELKALLSEVV